MLEAFGGINGPVNITDKDLNSITGKVNRSGDKMEAELGFPKDSGVRFNRTDGSRHAAIYERDSGLAIYVFDTNGATVKTYIVISSTEMVVNGNLRCTGSFDTDGTATGVTAANGDNSVTFATTQFVNTAITNSALAARVKALENA